MTNLSKQSFNAVRGFQISPGTMIPVYESYDMISSIELQVKTTRVTNLIFIIFKYSKSAVTDLKSSQNSKIMSTTLFLESKAEVSNRPN